MPTPFSNLQDTKLKARRAAAAPTAAEFADVMKVTMQAANTKLEAVYPALFTSRGVKSTALYSFDGARIHKSAIMPDKQGQCLLSPHGWTPAMQVTLPRYSPDLHQVIEHSHGRAELKFRKWLYRHPVNLTTAEYQAVFEKIYMECNNSAVIKADVAGLPAVYEEVYQNGGNWAPARLR
jgi:hypothetical protein